MKPKNLVWRIVLLVSVILFVVSCQYFLKGCFWWNCAPERDFRVLDWELPSDLFPKDARLSSLAPSSEGAEEVERGSQVIFWNKSNGEALYSIKRYSTINDAIRNYEHLAKEENAKKNNFGLDFAQGQIYRSKTADNFLIVCVNQERESCNMIARYQEYTIRFYSDIDDNMTYSDYENVLDYIDEQISGRLYP